MSHVTVHSSRPGLGMFLLAIGAIGLITGLVPFVTNGLRIVVAPDLWNAVDLAAHGVEAMGLGVEWGMLSSAMGASLGLLLLAAGWGWRKGAPWAAAVTYCYIVVGIAVNFTDMAIFLFKAKPGPMRSQMLFFDGIAFAIPVALAVYLAVTGKSNVESQNP